MRKYASAFGFIIRQLSRCDDWENRQTEVPYSRFKDTLLLTTIQGVEHFFYKAVYLHMHAHICGWYTCLWVPSHWSTGEEKVLNPPKCLKRYRVFWISSEHKNILGLADKITQHQHSGLHFKQDEQEDKAAFEIQTQLNQKAWVCSILIILCFKIKKKANFVLDFFLQDACWI